jgi:myo-inositol 2-dehydrogenase/D-chiro-inositol 1-dehydrogenase
VSGPLRVGVVGCGRVAATRHLPALRALPEASIVALADLDPVRLHGVADQFDVLRRYAEVERLLDDAAVEAVAVCVPAEHHVPVGLAALEAGKHVLIEKPLALSLDDCDRLIERAARSSVKATVGFNLRHHRLVRRARDLVRRGAVGQPELIRTAFTSQVRERIAFPDWRDRRDRGGGVLMEVATHHVDLWRFLLDSEVEEVAAALRVGGSSDEIAVVTARLSNGALASSVFSERTVEEQHVDIFGRVGRLQVLGYRFDGLAVTTTAEPPGSLSVRWRGVARAMRELPRVLARRRMGGDFLASYAVQWRRFVEAVRHDRPVGATLDDGRRALQIILAAAVSASTGCWVPVQAAPRDIGSALAGGAGGRAGSGHAD